MPDIVSRIRIEALGADQAAREVRKLRDAYNEVGQAARNLSPEAIGGGDPFSKATAAPGGGTYGGQRAPADIMERESRSRTYQDQVRNREMANFRGAPGGVSQGVGMAEAAAQGRGGAALGMGASGLGALLGGPIGLGLLATAATAMGIQKFADKEADRIRDIWGTGISQRLGRNYEDIEGLQLSYGRTGVPIGMVKSFFQSASQAGFNMNQPGAVGATNVMMEAMASMGLDPNAAAGLLGGVSRAGLELGRFGGDRGFNFMGQVNQTFGRENASMYLQEIARGINSMSTKGISITEESLTRQINLTGALRQIGGFTPEGAVAMAQRLQERGVAAAQLQKPEDVLALAAVRRRGELGGVSLAGKPLSEILVAMEQNAGQVSQIMADYLMRVSGGDTELARFRYQDYLGAGAPMGQAIKGLTTARGLREKSQEELSQELGAGSAWIGRRRDAFGRMVYDDPIRTTNAILQSEMFRGAEKRMLDFTASATRRLRELFLGPLNTNALDVTWGGIQIDFKDQMNYILPKDLMGAEMLKEIRGKPDITASISGMLRSANVTSPMAAIEDMSSFNWKGGTNTLIDMIARGMVEDTRAAAKAGVEGVAEDPKLSGLMRLMREFGELEVTNAEQLDKVLKDFIAAAEKLNYVLTDED